MTINAWHDVKVGKKCCVEEILIKKLLTEILKEHRKGIRKNLGKNKFINE